MKNSFYKNKVDHYMRLMIKEILQDVQKKGLIQDQHFYISFNTNCKGVTMPQYLRSKHAGEMMIVIQDEFDNLRVDDAGFGITLVFSGKAEDIYISFNSMSTFVDPSANFSLVLDPKMSLFRDNMSQGKTCSKVPDNIIEFPQQ